MAFVVAVAVDQLYWHSLLTLDVVRDHYLPHHIQILAFVALSFPYQRQLHADKIPEHQHLNLIPIVIADLMLDHLPKKGRNKIDIFKS